MQSKWHIIRTENELSQLIQACKTTGYASVDFETNGVGLYMQSFIPTILSVSFEAGSGYSIPLAHFEMPEDHPWLKWLTKFGRQVMEDPDIVKLGWNVKFDYQIFHKYHIYPKGTTIDGMLSKYLLDENRPHGLKDMVRRYLPQFADYENSIKDDEETRKVKWDSVPLEELCRYGCLDVDCTLRLCLFFEKKLIDNNLYHLLRHLYMPMSKVIQETEENGMTLDIDFNNQLLESYKTKIDQLQEDLLSLPRVKKFHKWYSQERIDEYIDKLNGEISSMVSDKDYRKIALRQQKIAQVTNGVFTTREEQALIRPINLNSTRDLAMLLYSDKGMGFECKTYTDTGNPSTAEDTLTDLRLTIEDPESYRAVFLDKLADLRATSKMYTTYIEGWHNSVQDDGKLHGSFLLHGTTSGRLSCLSGDTKILTNKGLIEISQLCGVVISDGLLVMTRAGWKPLKNFIYKGLDKLYEVTLLDGTTVKCTLKHKFIMPDGSTKTLKSLYSKYRSTITNKLELLKYEESSSTDNPL